jgi:phage tail tape-measure protein
MKYLGNPQSGSMAGTTASHNSAGQYLRSRRSPVQPVGTGRRAAIRTAFAAASRGYAGLTSANQAAWAAYASSYPVTDALGQSITLSGQQMFVAIATQLLNVGASAPTVPPTSNVVASAGVPTLTFVHAGAVTLTPTGLGAMADYQIYSFSAPQTSGTSFCKTFWQGGHVAGNSVTAIVATTAYNAQFGPGAAGQRVFFKVTPVNQYGVTGVPYIGFATLT